jgi:hypothetical protein
MTITRLHIIIILLLLLSFGGLFYLRKVRRAQVQSEVVPLPQVEAEAPPPVTQVPLAIAQAPITAPLKEEPPQALSYTVRRGETLWSIAKAKLGRGSRWYDIWKQNEDVIEDFDNVPAGTQIILPLDQGGVKWKKTSPEVKAKLLAKDPPASLITPRDPPSNRVPLPIGNN